MESESGSFQEGKGRRLIHEILRRERGTGGDAVKVGFRAG